MARPPGPPGNLNANLGGPRPPLPVGQQQIIRGPPPPQLRRTDSRQFIQTPIPGQQLPINAQQRPQLQQQPSIGQYLPGQGQPQRPPSAGGLSQQPQQFPQRPPISNTTQPQRPQLPLQQQPLNRPLVPNQPQQLANARPSPQIRPQTQPIGNLPNSGTLRPAINPQRPPLSAPIRQQAPPYAQQTQNQLYSQNSFEQNPNNQEQNSMSTDISAFRNEPQRSGSVLSNDDDDDVVMGKTPSPMPTPIKTNDYQNSKSPSPINSTIAPNQSSLQRNDSKQSIPSRPQSANRTPTPENVKLLTDNDALPKISENYSSSAKFAPEQRDQTRPPSVSFKEDTIDKIKSSSPDTMTPKHQPKSPISLNSIINTDRPGTPTNRPMTPTSKVATPTRSSTPGFVKSDDSSHRNKIDATPSLNERTTTPTSEKFRTNPMAKPNDNAPTKRDNFKSSIKFSKTFF